MGKDRDHGQQELFENKVPRYNLYSCNHDDKFRYLLGNSGVKPLIGIGVNPSVANVYSSDPTCHKAEEISRRKGWQGYIMLNLYPGRATDFSRLPMEPDGEQYRINIEAIVDQFSKNRDFDVWAAWGDLIEQRDYLLSAALEIMERSLEYRMRWLHLGSLTARGHGRHPSRLDYSWDLQELDIEIYMNRLSFLLSKKKPGA